MQKVRIEGRKLKLRAKVEINLIDRKKEYIYFWIYPKLHVITYKNWTPLSSPLFITCPKKTMVFQQIKNNIVFFLQHQQNLAKWNFVR